MSNHEVDCPHDQQFNPHPRSVYDYATQEDLRKGLSEVAAAAAPNTIHIPFESEPDPELDIDWRVDNVDRERSYEQTVEREMNRLLVLKSYLDLDYEALIAEGCAFDGITRLVKKYFDVPICLLVLLDIGRLWVLSREGKQLNLNPRKSSFCSHVIISNQECYIVTDASQDPRLCNFECVTAENGVRFYAACPLKSPEGYKIGTLCILDPKPRPEGLSPEDQLALKDFARLAMDALIHQRDLHRKSKQLEMSARQIASASHDLVTPLSVLQLSLSLLNEDARFLGRLDDAQRECLKAVSNSSKTMGGVCKSLKMKGTRSDNQKYGILASEPWQCSSGLLTSSGSVRTQKPVCIETKKLIHRLNELAAKFVAAKAVSLTISVDEGVPFLWAGDEAQILHISLHLLLNSVERASNGPVKFLVRLGESDGQRELVFQCLSSDFSSANASDESLAAIFDVQVYSSFSARALDVRVQENHDGRSSPLGILTSDYIQSFPSSVAERPPGLDPFSLQIRSLGGSFGVSRDAVSHETIIWFAIPLVVPEDTTFHEHKREYDNVAIMKPAAASRDEGPKRALVIDDCKIMRKMLSRALGQLGYETFQAADGMEGLKLMQEHMYDLVLLDFLMPVLDGLDCIRAYRKWEQQHRPGYIQFVCGMSAHASSNDVERGLRYGMTDYRPKPFTITDLKQLKELSKHCAINAAAMERVSCTMTPPQDPPSKMMKREYTQSPAAGHRVPTGAKACLVIVPVDQAKDIGKLSGLVSNSGWHASITVSWNEAVCLLKARNWDAVLLDHAIPGMNGKHGIAAFREWEASHRVHRQSRVLLMGRGILPSRINEQLHYVHVPEGFDNVVETPCNEDELACILNGLEKGKAGFGEGDIVTSA